MSMDATLIDKYAVASRHIELRFAARRADTWPGYYSTLGRAGYWLGDEKYHRYIGRSKAEALALFERYRGEI